MFYKGQELALEKALVEGELIYVAQSSQGVFNDFTTRSSSFKFHLLYGFECFLTACLILLSSRGFTVVVLHYQSETCK